MTGVTTEQMSDVPMRTRGHGDFGRWDARDDPDGDVTWPFALNNPPSRWNPAEHMWDNTTTGVPS